MQQPAAGCASRSGQLLFTPMEATIMLATFVRAPRCEVDPASDPQPVGRMFLVPRHGMPMRVLLRPSGTEPVIRVMVETRQSDVAEQVAGQLADAVRLAMS